MFGLIVDINQQVIKDPSVVCFPTHYIQPL